MRADITGHGDGVFLQDRQRVGRGRWVGDGRSRGDHARIIARHVRYHETYHRRGRGGGGEPAALDRRQMPAHAVHFRDGRAALQQRLVDGLLVGEAHAFGGKREKRRAATRNEAKHKVFGSQTPDHGENAFGRFLPGGVGDWMARFDHFDPPAGRAVAIARDHQAFERTLPMILDRLGHRAAGFARADDDGAAFPAGAEDAPAGTFQARPRRPPPQTCREAANADHLSLRFAIPFK